MYNTGGYYGWCRNYKCFFCTSIFKKFRLQVYALAVAELVDNSIDAGATDVDVINLSEEEIGQGNRQSYQKVKSIGILDNGSGMDLNTLHRCLSLGWGTKLRRSQV